MKLLIEINKDDDSFTSAASWYKHKLNDTSCEHQPMEQTTWRQKIYAIADRSLWMKLLSNWKYTVACETTGQAKTVSLLSQWILYYSLMSISSCKLFIITSRLTFWWLDRRMFSRWALLSTCDTRTYVSFCCIWRWQTGQVMNQTSTLGKLNAHSSLGWTSVSDVVLWSLKAHCVNSHQSENSWDQFSRYINTIKIMFCSVKRQTAAEMKKQNKTENFNITSCVSSTVYCGLVTCHNH
jgi:hypothetical protein